MGIKPRLFSYSFLLLVIFLVTAIPLFSLEGEGINLESAFSQNTLNRLIAISEQLTQLNERLHSDLQDSRQNSRELQNMLEASRLELNVLRQELETLRNVSTELLNKAENSQTESTMLSTALKKAESSLVSLEQSFVLYQQASEIRIRNLERENKLWKWGCAAAGIFAAGLCATMLFGR